MNEFELMSDSCEKVIRHVEMIEKNINHLSDKISSRLNAICKEMLPHIYNIQTFQQVTPKNYKKITTMGTCYNNPNVGYASPNKYIYFENDFVLYRYKNNYCQEFSLNLSSKDEKIVNEHPLKSEYDKLPFLKKKLIVDLGLKKRNLNGFMKIMKDQSYHNLIEQISFKFAGLEIFE